MRASPGWRKKGRTCALPQPLAAAGFDSRALAPPAGMRPHLACRPHAWAAHLRHTRTMSVRLWHTHDGATQRGASHALAKAAATAQQRAADSGIIFAEALRQ